MNNMIIAKESESRYSMQKEYAGTNKVVNQIAPKVSISVPTYQHEKYIGKCLDGILMQKTDFDFEIIIGEDESTDDTRKICIQYAEKHPEKIRLFLRERNVSNLYDKDGNLLCRYNSRWNILSARGKYIAVCDGDDYWTDPLKLQKQVDFLDTNVDYGMIYSNITLIDSQGNGFENHYTYQKNLKLYKSGFIFWDLIEDNFINTLTICVRREILTNYFLEFSNDGFVYDLRYWLYLSIRFKIKYSKDKMACYRVHDAGLSRRKDFFIKRKPLVIQSAILDLLTTENREINMNWLILSKQLYKLLFNKNLTKKEKGPLFTYLKENPRYLFLIVIGFFNKIYLKTQSK